MIYRALAEFAEREGLLAEIVYQPGEVAYLVHVDKNGRYLRYESPREERGDHGGKSKHPRLRPPRRPIPRRSDRRAVALAEFLVDKAEYVFGIDPLGARATDDLEHRRRLFLERVDKMLLRLPDKPGLHALRTLLAGETPEEIRTLLAATTTVERTALAGALFAFIYEPDGGVACIHDDPDVKAYFGGLLADETGERGQCLVTGQLDVPLVRLHAKPKGIPPRGETGRGVPLTSINQDSFKSYGLDSVGGAPISTGANIAIELALNRLLDPAYPKPGTTEVFDKQHEQVSPDTVVVYWSREDSGLAWIAELEHGGPERVGALIRAPYKERVAPLDDPSAFYALFLSGTRGRGIVRSFIESTVKEIAANLDRYRQEAEIVRPFESPGSYPLQVLKRSLVPRGDLDQLHPALGTDLYLAILLGRPFPAVLLQSAVRRNRVELFPTKRNGQPDEAAFAARVSLLKAYLNRNHRKGIAVALDTARPDPPYRLGRLLAVIDRLQHHALGGVNATLVDRYYGSASSTPEAVFPTLVRRSQHHMGKLRREKPDLARAMDRLLQDVMTTLSTFPKTLNMEQQALFALGFYHQRQSFFTKKVEADHE